MSEQRKTVLVTGAAQGIGAGLAEAFAQAGYSVGVNCRTQESLEKRGVRVLEACRAHGARAVGLVGDVSDFAACELMVRQMVSELGAVDVLINNAGITRDENIVRMKEEDFDEVIASNLKSAYNMIRHVSPLMLRKRAGRIINITSVVGVYGNRGQANYAASKAGLIGLTKSVAKDLGPRGITCNAIAPGYISSAMSEAMPEKARGMILEATALRRFGAVRDVADTALFLASQGFITGQVVCVDGGLSM